MLKLKLFNFCTDTIIIFVLISLSIENIKAEDSYLSALHNSHQTNNGNSNVISRKDFAYTPDNNNHNGNGNGNGNGYDYQQHLPDNHYGPPVDHSYGPPADNYGPPSSSYEIHAITYPQKPVYGPPPFYGPPSSHPMPIYIHEDHPRDSWFWDKFKFKIDIYTIGKILLKLIIFKKIIKFIALICLLLVLPKLKNMMKDDDEEMDTMESRKISTDKEKLNERINDITNFALTAIDTFSRKYDNNCKRDQIWCRFQRMFDVVDSKYSYEKIVKLYLPESQIDTNEIN